MANSFECSSMTDEEFNMFYSMDRELFTLLIHSLGFDTNLAMQIVALLMWMEKLSGNNMLIIKGMLTLPLGTIQQIAREAVLCLKCAENDNYFSQCVGTSVTIRLLPEHMNNPFLDLGFFHSNRNNVMKGVSETIKTICERAFRDLVGEFAARGGISLVLGQGSEVAESSRMGERRNAVDGSGMVTPLLIQPQHSWQAELAARSPVVGESSGMGERRSAVDISGMVTPLLIQPQHPMHSWQGELAAGSPVVGESSRTAERRNEAGVFSGSMLGMPLLPQQPVMLWQGPLVWLPALPTYQVDALLPLGYSVPAMGLGLPMHMYGMERFPVNDMEGQRQLVVNEQGTNAAEEQVVPPGDRTLQLTFSRGYPVSEEEIRDFFTRRFGDFIEDFIMLDVGYARIVATSASVIEEITQGCRAMYTINAKPVLARKYIKKVQTLNLLM